MVNEVSQAKLFEMFGDLYFPDRSPIGRRLPDRQDTRGKIVTGPWRDWEDGDDGQRVSVFGNLTRDKIGMHVAGNLMQGQHRAALMAYQVGEDGMSVATGIDLDVAGNGHANVDHHFATPEKARAAAVRLREAAESLGLRVWLEVTKSGGYRVMVFHERVLAEQAQVLGYLLLKMAALSAKIEVFPKQVWASTTGNGLHLPYYRLSVERGRQVMQDWDSGEIIPLAEFVPAAWEGRTTPERLAEIVQGAWRDGAVKKAATRRQQRTEGLEADSALADPDKAPEAWAAQLGGCAALKTLVDRMEGGAQAGYEDWLRLATHLRQYGEWGRTEFHRLSATDNRYDEIETDNLLDSLTGGPTTCDKMGCRRDPQADCGMAEGRVCSISFACRAVLPIASNVKRGEWTEDWKFQDCTPDDASQWRITNEGVWQIKQSEDGEQIILVLHHQIYIKSRAYDVDTQEESVTLVWRRDGEWREATVSQTTIAETRSIICLASKGLLVNGTNARDVVAYLAHLLAYHQDNIPLETIVSTTGHKRVKGQDVFLFGREVISASDSSPAVGFNPEADSHGVLGAMRSEGDLDAWLALVRKMGAYPVAAFAIMAGLLAPALRDLKLTQNPIIDLAGRSSTGKSTLLALVASIWGLPPESQGGLIKNWHGTAVFNERLAQLVNDLPIFLDESHTARPETVQTIVYQYANGTGRGRGAKEGGVQRQAAYKGVLFSAGEVRLADASAHDGAQARILGFWGSPFGSGQGDLVQEIKDTIDTHYGLAGPAWVEQYLQFRAALMPQLLDTKRKAEQRLRATAKGDGIGERLAGLCAAVEVVGRVANTLFQLQWDVPAIVDDVFARLSENRKTPAAQTALELVGAWIASKPAAFLSDNQPATDQRELAGKIMEDGRVALLPAPLKEMLARHGCQYTSTLAMWADNGWLDADKDRGKRTTKMVRFDGASQRMVVLSVDGMRVARGLEEGEETVQTAGRAKSQALPAAEPENCLHLHPEDLISAPLLSEPEADPTDWATVFDSLT